MTENLPHSADYGSPSTVAALAATLAEHRLMFWTVEHVWGGESESSRTAPRCSCGVLRSGGGTGETLAAQVAWWERHVANALLLTPPPVPCRYGPHMYDEPCKCAERIAQVVTHTRTQTDQGPDFCAECSEALSEWVPWPCPTSVTPPGAPS